MTTQADQKPVTPGKDEQPALDALDALLSESAGNVGPQIMDLHGKAIALPESVVDSFARPCINW